MNDYQVFLKLISHGSIELQQIIDKIFKEEDEQNNDSNITNNIES